MAGPTLEIRVNGVARKANSPPGTLLIDYLRDVLGLKGTKFGCASGECGSCTLLLDGDPVCACLTTLGSAAGKSVITIEGIADSHSLHPVQQALLSFGALQCGYCTPGMVLSSVALLERNPRPGHDEVQRFLSGNLCPCGAYAQVVEALASFVEAPREH